MKEEDDDLSKLTDAELEARADRSRARLVGGVRELQAHLQPEHLKDVAEDTVEAAKSEVLSEVKEMTSGFTEHPIQSTVEFVKGLTGSEPPGPVGTALAVRDPAWQAGRRMSPVFGRLLRALGRHPTIAVFVGVAAGVGVFAILGLRKRRAAKAGSRRHPPSEPPLRLTSNTPLHA